MTTDTPADKAKKALMGAGAAVMVSLSALSAQSALKPVMAATATIPIIAHIIRAIEVTINTSIDFGTLAVTEDVAAQVTLDPVTGELRFDGKGGIALAGGTPTAGRIQVRGAPMPITVSMETNNVQLTNGTDFLTIHDFNIQTAAGGAQITITPAGPGDTAVLAIGASVITRPGQLSGTYIGSNRIFANYQ